MSKIVIALGGNALGNYPKEQQVLIEKAAMHMVPLIQEGHQILIGHGNGPQVGIINLAFEDSYENQNIPYMPFPECTAMSQGYIGYHLQKGIRSALEKKGIHKKVITLITQVKVDREDPSFQNPSKPVGPFYTKELAEQFMKDTGEVYIEDAGRGYRKVVASPKPFEVVEMETIKTLFNSDHIVIAGGGGGIPVFKQEETEGASAVIDKDSVSSLIATHLDADMLIILTNVDQAELYYGTEKASKIGKITVKEAQKYIEEGHFAKGSMLPKMQAAICFIQQGGKRAVITSLDNLNGVMNGEHTTEIVA